MLNPFKKANGTQSQNQIAIALYDSKTSVYGIPQFHLNEQVFLRGLHNFFQQQSQTPFDKQDQIWTNAEDFSFFKVGEYERESGTLVPCTPQHLVSLHEVKSTFEIENLRRSQVSQVPGMDARQ